MASSLLLCSKCATLDIRQPYYGPEYTKEGAAYALRIIYKHYDSLTELEASATSGSCSLCHLILDVIEKLNAQDALTVVDDWEHFDLLYDELDDDGADSDILSSLQQRHRNFFYDASATVDDDTDPDAPILLDFKFREPMRDEIASRCTDVTVHWTNSDGLTRRSVASLSLVSGLPNDLIRICGERDLRNDDSTGSRYSTNLARFWMQQCDAEHEICRERRELQQAVLPTRVVDVGSDSHQPFLYETKKNQSAEYVCLSHCWGGSRPLTTKTSSLSCRKIGIDFLRMPKTFQDAVIITRNLGIQYLWIDSLCIIQDSEEDWARESAQMGRIYRDATMTIFAEFADSDEGGCFMPRNGKDTALCRTPMLDELVEHISGNSSMHGPAFVQEKLHHGASTSMPKQHHIFETVRHLDPRSTKPLNSRGWVLQETVLSFRSLIYDQWEVRWSCPTLQACECIPEGFSRQTWLERDRPTDQKSNTIDHRELFNSWSSVVSEFTKRKLTFGRDKLPALAGMASEMSRYNQSVYFAGLWKESLRKDLAWFIPPKSSKAPYRETIRPQAFRAPSWSWASIEGKVTPVFELSDVNDSDESQSDRFKRASRLTCEILNCQVKHKSTLNMFGEVQEGILTVRGRLGHARCGTPISSTSHVDRIPIHDAQGGEELGWFDPDVTPAANRGHIDEIWCMPLHNSWGTLRCLALVADSTGTGLSATSSSLANEQMYARVGIISPKAVLSGLWEDSEIEKRSYLREDSNTAAANNRMLDWLEAASEVTVKIV